MFTAIQNNGKDHRRLLFKLGRWGRRSVINWCTVFVCLFVVCVFFLLCILAVKV